MYLVSGNEGALEFFGIANEGAGWLYQTIPPSYSRELDYADARSRCRTPWCTYHLEHFFARTANEEEVG